MLAWNYFFTLAKIGTEIHILHISFGVNIFSCKLPKVAS